MTLLDRPSVHSAWGGHLLPFAVAVAVFLGTAAILDPRIPFTLSKGFVESQPVKAGDEIRVDWTQTWTRRCKAESVRSILRPDKKVDFYVRSPIDPPDKTGPVKAIATAKLSTIMPQGDAAYQATVTFPAQISWGCIMLWPMSFTTPEVPFKVAP